MSVALRASDRYTSYANAWIETKQMTIDCSLTSSIIEHNFNVAKSFLLPSNILSKFVLFGSIWGNLHPSNHKCLQQRTLHIKEKTNTLQSSLHFLRRNDRVEIWIALLAMHWWHLWTCVCCVHLSCISVVFLDVTDVQKYRHQSVLWCTRKHSTHRVLSIWKSVLKCLFR